MARVIYESRSCVCFQNTSKLFQRHQPVKWPVVNVYKKNISGNSSDEESGKFYNIVFICSNRYIDFIVVFLDWVVTKVKEIVCFYVTFTPISFHHYRAIPKLANCPDHYMMRDMTKIILLMLRQQMVRPAWVPNFVSTTIWNLEVMHPTQN